MKGFCLVGGERASHGRVSELGHSCIGLSPQVTMSDECLWREHHISHYKLFIL